MEDAFHTPTGIDATAVSASEMRRVDRVAVKEVGLELLQMMENAGRGLAWHVRDLVDERAIVVAGNGGMEVAGWRVHATSRTGTFP